MSSNNGPNWGELGFWIFLSVLAVCSTIMYVLGQG